MNRLGHRSQPHDSDPNWRARPRTHGSANVCTAARRCQPTTDYDTDVTAVQTLAQLRDQRVCGKPRSTFEVAGSGHRDVTTFERV